MVQMILKKMNLDNMEEIKIEFKKLWVPPI